MVLKSWQGFFADFIENLDYEKIIKVFVSKISISQNKHHLEVVSLLRRVITRNEPATSLSTQIL